MSQTRLVHHELCFGCGRTNLFGLLMDVERIGAGAVRARGFVKQDHQGASRGEAHEGIILAALSDAMALACGPDMRVARVELDLLAPAAVGFFLEVEARTGAQTEAGVEASATGRVEDRLVARAVGVYTRT